MIKRKIKNSKGFTLVEILLVVGLIGLVSGGIYSLYSKTDETNSAIEETKRLVTYANLANASAGSSGTYSHVDIPYIEGMGVEVNRNLGLSEISSPSPQRLEFKYNQIPSVVCSQMSLKILGANMGFDVIINGSNINKNEDTVTQVAVACASNLSNITYALNSNLTGASLTNEANVGAYDYNAGNASSKSNASSWNSSVATIVPNLDGSSFSHLTTENKYGYLGGVGSISSTPTSPVDNPRPPPTTGISTGDPYNGGSPGNIGDRDAKITLADLTIRVGDERYTKVTVEGMNFIITGLNPTQSYSLQISSRAFNLSSVNPVAIGEKTDTVDELNINFTANNKGKAQVYISDIFDISQYFVIANREMEDTTPSMKNFLENTLETLPFFADIISQRTGMLVTELEFKPTIILPPPNSLKTKEIFYSTQQLQGSGAPGHQNYEYLAEKIYYERKNGNYNYRSVTLTYDPFKPYGSYLYIGNRTISGLRGLCVSMAFDSKETLFYSLSETYPAPNQTTQWNWMYANKKASYDFFQNAKYVVCILSGDDGGV